MMQRPPLPLKQHTKFFKSPDSYEALKTTPREFAANSQTHLEASQPFEENETITLENEKFIRLLQEKTSEIEFLKSKLGISELTTSQIKSSKTKLLEELEERKGENRLELTRLKNLIEEKSLENNTLNIKLNKYEEICQDNSSLIAKISEMESSIKLVVGDLSKSKALLIELESENSILKNQKKENEHELQELRDFEKVVQTQLKKKNEQIEDLRRYVNNLEFKFKDLEKIKSLEKYMVLMGGEIERLQKVLSKKSDESEHLKVKIMEFQKEYQKIGNYEKTISNLALEIERLKTKSPNPFDPKASDIYENTMNSVRTGFKNPKQVLYGEIDRMNNLFKNEHQDFETINQEYQKVMKENIGFIEKMDGVESEIDQLKTILRGKEREIQELRFAKEGAKNYLVKTSEKKPSNEEVNTLRKYTH